MTPQVVVAGNLLVDDLVFPDGRTRMGQAGGAVLYASLGAALWGVSVGCVGLAGSDYPAETLDALEARGIRLDGVRPLGRPGVRAWLLYEGRVRRVVHRLGGPSHAEVSPDESDVPAGWTSADAFHIAPMPLAIQARLVGACARHAAGLVSLDPHEPITDGSLARWAELLASVDLFVPGEDELRLARATSDPHGLLRELATGRLRCVAFKQGERGGLLFDAASGRVQVWTALAETVVDPTGAGDAFAAGLLAGLVEVLPIEACLQRAVVSASFAIEDWGASGLLRATRDEAEHRLSAWFPGVVRA